MKKPSEDKIDSVLNNWGTKEEANFVAKWFATDEGQLYLGKRMDSEYSERKIKDVSSCSMTGKSIDTIFRNSQRKKRYLTVFRVAAVLIPFFILSGAIYLLNTNIDLLGTSNLKTVTTRKKEKMHMVFQDGTEVFLAPETTLKFPEKFGLTKRNIALNGEAFFKVAKNTYRPFIVDMKGSNIEVLGTSFLVKSYNDDDDIDILLEEGSVNFSTGTNSSLLKAGQKLKYSKKTGVLTVKENEDSGNYKNWRNNIIVFNNNKLAVVLKTLNRWYGKNFVIKDKEITKFTYTTTFYDAPLDAILQEIEEVSPIQFSSKNDSIFVSGVGK